MCVCVRARAHSRSIHSTPVTSSHRVRTSASSPPSRNPHNRHSSSSRIAVSTLPHSRPKHGATFICALSLLPSPSLSLFLALSPCNVRQSLPMYTPTKLPHRHHAQSSARTVSSAARALAQRITAHHRANGCDWPVWQRPRPISGSHPLFVPTHPSACVCSQQKNGFRSSQTLIAGIACARNQIKHIATGCARRCGASARLFARSAGRALVPGDITLSYTPTRGTTRTHI